MRTGFAVLLSILIATTALAQSAEYGRDSAGVIDMTAKQSRQFDGSFSLSTSRSLGATFGGTLVKDRVWFFASADRESPLIRTAAMPASMTDLSAVLTKSRVSMPVTLPSNFLSLRSTTLISPNSFFTINVQSTR